MLAGTVAEGDVVWTTSAVDTAQGTAQLKVTPKVVTAVATVLRDGAYNFILEQSDDEPHFRSLVADGVIASSFTTDWRLINTFGFDMADKLFNPIRRLVRQGMTISGGAVNGVK